MSGSGRNNNKAVLKSIRAIVGPDGMRDLSAERGGTEVCIPRECDGDHWMSRILGEDIANKVCEHFAVINADGRIVGDVRCYIPMQNSRIAAVYQQIEEEIKNALIAGKTVNDICRDVGVSVRRIRDQLKFLREQGVLPMPARPHVRSFPQAETPAKGELRRVRAEKVDEMLLAGKTSRAIMLATGAGATVVRQRRRQLLYAGRLPIGNRMTVSLSSRANTVSDAIGSVDEFRDTESPDEVRS